MKKIIITVLPFTILIGVFCFVFSIIDQGELTVLSQQQIQYGSYTWTFYRFNVHQYLLNLETSGDITQLAQIFPQNPPVIPSTPQNWADIIQWIKFLTNILFIWLFNWIIYILNIILLVPLKIILYPVNIILAIMGINTADDTFIEIINLLYNFRIPEIPQI